MVLSPSREIKVFAEGAEVFAFHGAAWHLLDLKAKYEVWAEAVGNPLLALRLFQTALDLADAREGALFVVLRDPADAVPAWWRPGDRLDVCDRSEMHQVRRRLAAWNPASCSRGRTATDLDPSVLVDARARSTAPSWLTATAGCSQPAPSCGIRRRRNSSRAR